MFLIGSFIWIIFFIIAAAIHIERRGTETFKILGIVGYVWLGLSVLYVWYETWESDERQFLSKEFDTENATNVLNTFLSTKPDVLVKTVSFHYEKRTRRVKRGDRYVNETYTVRVNTHRDSAAFQLNSFNDVSDVESMPVLDGKGVTFMELNFLVLLADDESKCALEAKKMEMVEKNKHFDTHINCFVEEELEGFRNHFMIGDDNKGVPWWMDNLWFCLATCFWCVWPYRLLLKKNSKKKEFLYLKEVSVKHNAFLNPGPPIAPAAYDNFYGPMSDTSNIVAPPIASEVGAGGISMRYVATTGTAIPFPAENPYGHRIPLSAIPMYSSNNLGEPADAPPSYDSLEVEDKY